MIDLIIPSYNDYDGLCATMNSIGPWYDELVISIIDDASTTITDTMWEIFQNQYKNYKLNLFRLPTNQGPGYARQYAIERTTEPYILFIDCGDLFYSPYSMLQYIQFITTTPNGDCLMSPYYYEITLKTLLVKINDHGELHGSLIKRKFLQQYNLKIPNTYSYSLEDTSFMTYVNTISTMEKTHFDNDSPMVIRTFNPHSLTKNTQFYFENLIRGYTENSLTILSQITNIENIFVEELNAPLFDVLIGNLIMGIYTLYLQIVKEAPEYLNTLSYAHNFYMQYYYPKKQEFEQLLVHLARERIRTGWFYDTFNTESLYGMSQFFQYLESAGD